MSICVDYFILISELGVGSFGIVYQVYNNRLGIDTAIKIQKFGKEDELKKEIAIFEKLSSYKIESIPKYYSSGRCYINFRENLYYEMELLKGNFSELLKNNTLTRKQFFDIIFELIYGLSVFRKIGFKHRDIAYYNILYRINKNSRKYMIHGTEVIIRSIIQPVYADFNTSIFEKYNLDNAEDFNDILSVLNIIQDMAEITELSDQDLEVVSIFLNTITDGDDLSSSFLEQTLMLLV